MIFKNLPKSKRYKMELILRHKNQILIKGQLKYLLSKLKHLFTLMNVD